MGLTTSVGPFRIPVAVLQNPRVDGGFVVVGVVRHSRGELGRGQVGVEALAGLLFSAGDVVAVAVPRLANIAVSGPGGDLLPVEAGGDEVGDRAVSCLVWSDRLATGVAPRFFLRGAGG